MFMRIEHIGVHNTMTLRLKSVSNAVGVIIGKVKA